MRHTGQRIIENPHLLLRGLHPVVATIRFRPVSYTHLRAHETVLDIVCRLLLEKKPTTPLPDEVDLCK